MKVFTLFRNLPRLFWVANLLELFERGVDCGMNSVLAVYLAVSVQSGG